MMPIKNLAQFQKNLRESIPELTEKNVVRFVKKLGLQLLKGVVLKTPVDTGRARGGWQVTLNDPALASPVTTDKSGGSTISKGLSVLSNLPPYPLVWISNNVSYIEHLETGTSTQAPDGMVDVTLVEINTQF